MAKLLFLSAELPFPPTSGGRMKSWKFVEFLARHYDLDVACPLKYGTEHVEEFLDTLKPGKFMTEEVQVPRSAKSLLKSWLRGIPLNVLRTFGSDLARQVQACYQDYDIIVCDHYEVAEYVPKDFRGKLVLHEHNAYYLMWERYAESGPNFAFRTVCKLEALRVRRYEAAIAARADLVFASPNDIESLADIGVDKHKCRVTYHLGDDSQLELPALKFNDTDKSLLYVGTLNWEANVDGLLWFFEQVWPQVKAIHPDLRFLVVGGNADQRLLDAASNEPDIEFVGFAKELEPYFRKGRVFLAPLRFGAGIKVKVLNAMARGIPVVTTSIGSEGIKAKTMTHLAITDENDQMVEAIDTLLTNQDAWETLERNSRLLITEHYTWDKVFSDMKQELDSLRTETHTGAPDVAEGLHSHS